MKINRISKIGLIEKKKSFNGKCLMLLDFKKNELQLLDDYEDFEPLDISDNSELIILNSQWISHRGTNKTEIVVLNICTKEIIFSTKDYLVYGAIFDKGDKKILIDAYNKKLFSLDLKTLEKSELPKKELRILEGTFLKSENKFYVPSKTKKNCVFCFSFDKGVTNEILINVNAKIQNIKFFNKTFVVLSEDDVLYSFSENFKVKNWEIDFKKMEDKPSRISTKILCSESQSLIFLSAPSTQKNNWGVDYCVNLKSGKILNLINHEKGRGRIAEHFFNDDVLLHTGRILNMTNGKITEEDIKVKFEVIDK